MSFFVFPQGWIGPALAAAAITFGPLGISVDIKYEDLPGKGLGEARAPATIVVDKRPDNFWTRYQAQCLLAHEYAHLRGRPHSDNPRSIMYPVLDPEPCLRWIKRRGLQ